MNNLDVRLYYALANTQEEKPRRFVQKLGTFFGNLLMGLLKATSAVAIWLIVCVMIAKWSLMILVNSMKPVYNGEPLKPLDKKQVGEVLKDHKINFDDPEDRLKYLYVAAHAVVAQMYENAGAASHEAMQLAEKTIDQWIA